MTAAILAPIMLYVLYFPVRMLMTGTAIVMTSRGLIDYSTGLGFIGWDEIRGARATSYMGSAMVALDLENPLKVIERLPAIRAWTWRLYLKTPGNRLSLAAAFVEGGQDAVLRAIREHIPGGGSQHAEAGVTDGPVGQAEASRDLASIAAARRTLALRCLVVWLVALLVIAGAASSRGATWETFTHTNSEGKLSWWQVLMFGTSLTAFGFYFAARPHTGAEPFPTGAWSLRAKGWIFAGTGVLLVLRALSALASGDP